LLSGCTPNVIAPPTKFATISQPLCRKNAECGLWSTVGIVSVPAVDMGVGRYAVGLVQGSDFREDFKAGHLLAAHARCAKLAVLGKTRV
jgi:hypothetical protein